MLAELGRSFIGRRDELAALQGAVRYCVDGPCGDGESLHPSVRFR